MMTRLMRSTIFECEKHIFVSITFHACRPGQELVHVFGPGEHNWTALYNMYVFFVLQSISKSNCQLFNMNTWNSRSQFSNLKVEYLEIVLGLLPPAARLLLPPVAKMMTEFLSTYKRTHHTNLVEHVHLKIRACQLRGQQKLLFFCIDMGGGGVTLLFTIFWTKNICNK